MRENYDIKEIEKYYLITENGEVFSKIKNRWLKPAQNNCGYVSYFITHPYYKRIFAHRLVALKYIGNRPANYDINHKDNNKGNNHYSNLEYITHSDNVLKGYKEHGRISYWKGKNKLSFSLETRIKMSNAKKKRIEVFRFNKSLGIFESIQDIVDKLGFYRVKISRALKNNGKYKEYNFKVINDEIII